MRFMHIVNTDKNPGGLHEGTLFCLWFFSFRFGAGFYLNSSRCSKMGTKSGSSYLECSKLYFPILVLTPLYPQEGKSVSFADLISQVFNFKSPCGVVQHRMAISDFCDL